MKKRIKILPFLLTTLLMVGIFSSLETTKTIKKAKATPTTERVAWGYNNTRLYLACSLTEEVISAGTFGWIDIDDYDTLPYYRYSHAIKEIVVQDKISLRRYDKFFYDFTSLEKITNIYNLDTSNAVSFKYMFASSHCSETLDLSIFDTSKAIDMSYMFSDFNGPKIDVSSFDTSNVRSFNSMFYNFNGDVDVSNFKIKEQSDLSNMFAYSANIQKVHFKEFGLKDCNLTDMFRSSSIGTIDLSNCKTNGYLPYELLSNASATILHLPDETNIGDGLKDFEGAFSYVFCSKEVPTLSEDSKTTITNTHPKILVPASCYDLYANDDFFKTFTSGKFVAIYFINIIILGRGTFTLEGYENGYITKANIEGNHWMLGIINPNENYVLAENGISIVDSNNNPVEFDYSDNTFYMPFSDITITVKYVSTIPIFAFADMFLETTGEVCELGYNNLSSLQAIWGDIVTSYNGLGEDDKAVLLNSNDDIRLINTLRRYSYIISKYNTETTKNLVEFIDGFTITYSARDSFIKTEDFDTTLVLLISIISAGGLFTILLSNKKRKLN